MKTVSITDDNQYLEDVSAYGYWTPECPYCGDDYANVEPDFQDYIFCEGCEQKYKVEGL